MSGNLSDMATDVCNMFVMKFLLENGHDKVALKFQKIAKPPGTNKYLFLNVTFLGVFSNKNILRFGTSIEYYLVFKES